MCSITLCLCQTEILFVFIWTKPSCLNRMSIFSKILWLFCVSAVLNLAPLFARNKPNYGSLTTYWGILETMGNQRTLYDKYCFWARKYGNVIYFKTPDQASLLVIKYALWTLVNVRQKISWWPVYDYQHCCQWVITGTPNDRKCSQIRQKCLKWFSLSFMTSFVNLELL